MKNKILYCLLIPLLAVCLTACFKDKGNNTYIDVPDLIVEGIPETIEVLGGVERILVRPVINTPEGVVKGDDPNFSFVYKTGYSDTLARVMELDTMANFRSGTYTCWFIATDNRTGQAASAVFTLKVATTVYEGYMVLCNEGTEERARLDMISHIAAGRDVLARDVMPLLGMPAAHHATRIGFNVTNYATEGTLIYL
ncbi:MAG: hypothetical protein LBI96_01295, partial [Odoribacteraceae bacterium]|nr:hypothetical protein [Odoribacteraceae bacterium]